MRPIRLNLPFTKQKTQAVPAFQGPGVPSTVFLSPNEYQLQLGVRFTPFTKNAFERKKLPSPGAQNYAYESYGLPEFTFIGPAVANRMMLRPLQPPPVYALQQASVAGVGGLSAGQIIGQPLINVQPGTTFDTMAAPTSDIPIL